MDWIKEAAEEIKSDLHLYDNDLTERDMEEIIEKHYIEYHKTCRSMENVVMVPVEVEAPKIDD